jgi:hypothetical protein
VGLLDHVVGVDGHVLVDGIVDAIALRTRKHGLVGDVL